MLREKQDHQNAFSFTGAPRFPEWGSLRYTCKLLSPCAWQVAHTLFRTFKCGRGKWTGDKQSALHLQSAPCWHLPLPLSIEEMSHSPVTLQKMETDWLPNINIVLMVLRNDYSWEHTLWIALGPFLVAAFLIDQRNLCWCFCCTACLEWAVASEIYRPHVLKVSTWWEGACEKHPL